MNETHNYDTRQIQNNVYFKPKINKSIGKKRLVYGAFELWKNIDESLKLLNWPSFKKNTKKYNECLLINENITVTLLLPN